jgi:hypothetical protein
MSIGFKLRDRLVSLDDLILDANNYRLSFEHDGKQYSDKEAETTEIQLDTHKKLVKEKLADLKDSILENGFLEVDRIVVRQSENSKKFIVIEGNRRTAAFKALINESVNNKRALTGDLKNKANSINVIEITGDRDDIDRYAATLMGIRHVSGPKKWPGIQSARLIYDLKKKGKQISQIGALLGISGMDANRRLRGFLAYKQMREDKVYKSLVKKKHYTLLLEFLPIRNSTGKDWLDWNENKLKFENSDNRKRLYQALTKPLENGKAEVSNPDDARLFLKALSIESFKAEIEKNEISIHQFGPIVDKHNSKKIIEDFEKFLDRLDSSCSTETKQSLRNVKASIDKIVGL